MNQDIFPYIIDGISIDKTAEGYNVFTIPTQHFKISSLEELTVECFELAIEDLKKRDEIQNEISKAYYKRKTKREIVNFLTSFCHEQDFAFESFDHNKLEEELGPFEKISDQTIGEDRQIVYFFNHHNVYIMIEGWNVSSMGCEFDSGYLVVEPSHTLKNELIYCRDKEDVYVEKTDTELYKAKMLEVNEKTFTYMHYDDHHHDICILERLVDGWILVGNIIQKEI